MPIKRIIRKKRNFKKTPYKRRVARSNLTIQKVKRMIKSSQETKFVTTEYGFTTFNSAISSVADIIAVLPALPRGNEDNRRIGSTVRPVKMVIRGYVVYNNYVDVNFQPREILTRRFLFQDKAVKCYTDGASVSLDLLDKGGLAEQFSGTQLSYLLPHNTHRHTFFKDQRHVIMKPFGYMNNPGADAMTSVDKSMFKPFTITLTQKQLPAVLHWDENESVNYPINFAPYLALGYADAFGAAADTTTTQIGMSFVSTLYYKDA